MVQPRPVARELTLALCLFLPLLPQASSAQDPRDDRSGWVGDLGVAGANALVGGVTALVSAAIRGEEELGDAFLKGAVGGTVVFAGKRLAVERFDGAGFLGREVGALGSSLAANGGAGRGWLDQVWLPLGPLWLQVSPASRHQVRINAPEIAVLVWAVRRPELDFDWGRSLSDGAAVFTAGRHRILADSRRANGVTLGGVVLLQARATDLEAVRAHEMVHVIQHDFVLHAWGRPLEAWAWRRGLGWEVPFDLVQIPTFLQPRLVRDLLEGEAEALGSR